MTDLLNPPAQYKPLIRKFLNEYENEILTAGHAAIFLDSLVKKKKLSHSAQRLIVSSLKWYYKNALGIKLTLPSPYRSKSLPTVLSINEVRLFFRRLKDPYLLMFKLMFGLGLKIGEVSSLRVKHIDINSGTITLSKNRTFKIPAVIFDELVTHLRKRQRQFSRDRLNGTYFIEKQNGRISSDFEEQPFFASRKRTKITSWQQGRQFIDPSTLHAMTKKAFKLAGITKQVTTMTMRHSFAVEVLKEKSHNIAELAYLLGQKDIRLTLEYRKVLPRPEISPINTLPCTPEDSFREDLRNAIRFPSETKMNAVLSHMKNDNLEFISKTSDSRSWQLWKKSAIQKKLDFSEGLYTRLETDYVFLDFRDLSNGSRHTKLKYLAHLLKIIRKKILLYIPRE